MKLVPWVWFSVAAGLIMAGCQKAPESSAEAGYTIAVIPKGTILDFWKSVEAGARRAEQELQAKGTRVTVIWKGPLREDDRDQQIQVVENFISRRVDGIVLAPLDSQALVKPVESAAQANIPVVIIDSALKSDLPISYVATDNHQGGELAGEHLAKLLGGKGRVILLRYQVGSASTEQREAGFLETMQRYPDITLISTDQYAGVTRETAYQAAQNLLNRFGDQVEGIFCPNETTTVAMTKALQDLSKAGGKVKMVGFDTGAQSVQDLRSGDTQALVVQDPMQMGYRGVLTLVKHLQGEPVEKVIDTGVQLVTQENMSQAEVERLLNPPLDKYLK